jgi:uncharacterized protein YbjT (DUF2867 family)
LIALGPGVQVFEGDITKKDTLPPAIEGTNHIIFTAGCRSGHPASESRIKTVEFEGVLNTLTSIRDTGFSGRFMYMTSSGIITHSLFSAGLNLYKGNTLAWRRRAEEGIRASGVDYTIIRTGMLLNSASRQRAVRITQEALPLSIRYPPVRTWLRCSSRQWNIRVPPVPHSKSFGRTVANRSLGPRFFRA